MEEEATEASAAKVALQAKVAVEEVPLEKEEDAVCPPTQLRQLNNTPLPYRLRQHYQWWEAHAPPPVLKLIRDGVEPAWPEPVLGVHPCHRAEEEETAARTLMSEYIELGAAHLVTDLAPSKYLIPWFLVKKPEVGGGRK